LAGITRGTPRSDSRLAARVGRVKEDECIDSGFYSSVMIDASAEEFDENIAITKRVVDAAHAKYIIHKSDVLGSAGQLDRVRSLVEQEAA